MEFYFFETKIWSTWLKLHKNWMLIVKEKKTIVLNIIPNSLNDTMGSLK